MNDKYEVRNNINYYGIKKCEKKLKQNTAIGGSYLVFFSIVLTDDNKLLIINYQAQNYLIDVL